MTQQTATCCDNNQATATTPNQAAKPNGNPTAKPRVFVPQVDIVESEDKILLVADLPGVGPEGLDVTLEKNVLTIRGTVTPEVVEGYQLAYSEYETGNYERAFTVSNDIERTGIEAVINDGVLRLTLPKAKHAVMQKIPVKTVS
jgi:HSP20 family molecular chaperone IbpA